MIDTVKADSPLISSHSRKPELDQIKHLFRCIRTLHVNHSESTSVMNTVLIRQAYIHPDRP